MDCVAMTVSLSDTDSDTAQEREGGHICDGVRTLTGHGRIQTNQQATSTDPVGHIYILTSPPTIPLLTLLGSLLNPS
jgi:hypothetical protein